MTSIGTVHKCACDIGGWVVVTGDATRGLIEQERDNPHLPTKQAAERFAVIMLRDGIDEAYRAA